jgi:DNA-directed RNA polymerase specialized sigma24 family protein
MNFPTTRYTLIQRIATTSAEEDWALFLTDYWRPLCRFAARWGRLELQDAEDVAGVTLEIVIRNGLLQRWAERRQARLSTLLCGVVRKVLANERRREIRRGQAFRDMLQTTAADLTDASLTEPVAPEEADAFYEAWADELLQSAIELLLDDYHREGRGDYFRVLYGRICEASSVAEIADSLSLKVADVDNYYRHARSRLETRLQELVRRHVQRYAGSDGTGSDGTGSDGTDEFEREWLQLGQFLEQRGGLEESLRQSYSEFDGEDLRDHEVESMTAIMKNVREYLRDQQEQSA